MSSRSWLAASLVANAGLVGIVAWQFIRADEADTPPHVADSAVIALSTAVAPLPREAAQNDAFDAEKALDLARLEFAARDANPLPRVEYWRSTGEAELARYEEAAERLRDEMRQRLLAKYGPDAVDDPAFARLFKPLNLTHPYLTSKAQLALARVQRTRRLASPAGGPGLPIAQVRDPAAAAEQQRAFESELRRALGDEYPEYQVRYSPLARQLRAGGAIQSEKQFREVLVTLQQMESNATPDDYMRIQNRLRTILGEPGYVQFSAVRDQAYPGFEAVGLRRQLSREQILGAYAVVLRAQNDLIAAGSDRGADPQAVVDARDAEIARLVGDSVAAEMIQTYSNSMVAASLKVMNDAR
jgi:hypothetical protein